MNDGRRNYSLGFGALLGAITGAPLVAFFYLGNQLANLPFVPFDLFDWLARILPGDIITIGIDTIVSFINLLGLGNTSGTAKTIEQMMALAFFIATLAFLGGLITFINDRVWFSAAGGGALVGFSTFFGIAGIELFLDGSGSPLTALPWIAVLTTGWGALTGIATSRYFSVGRDDEDEVNQTNRRAFLFRLVGGSAGLALGALGVGRLVDRRPEDTGAQLPLAEPVPTLTATPSTKPSHSPTSPPPVGIQPTIALREEVSPAPGTRPELTPTEDFYRIDINLTPPSVSQSNWRLETAGLFDSPGELTLDDLMAYPAVTQPITLSCISNRIGGDLIGTSNWTGVPLREIVADLGMHPEATAILVEAADSFYETVVMRDIMDPRTLLVYGMNGETLPEKHGFPLRIYIPDRYGMKQPKWIIRLTAIGDDGRGYWVDRGWSNEARPQIISIIDTVAEDIVAENGSIPVGGIAWAGARGIQRVEVQVDDGEWMEAMLRTPPLGQLTWVQWRYDWPAISGRHKFRVRAMDGNGALQIEEESGPRPDGATGYHSKTVSI